MCDALYECAGVFADTESATAKGGKREKRREEREDTDARQREECLEDEICCVCVACGCVNPRPSTWDETKRES